MTKMKNFINKFKSLLEEIEGAGIFEDVIVPESGKSLRIGDVGTPVKWISVDEAGVETEEAAAEGSYIGEDGRTIVVDAQGNLVEIKEKEVPVAPINPEEMTAEEIEAACKKKKLLEDEEAAKLAAIPPVEEAPVEVPVEEAPAEVDVTKKTLGELIDVTKDGEYYIAVSVMGGKIVEATVEAEMQLVNANEFAQVKTENDELKVKLASIKVKPAFTEFSTPSEKKADTSKMNNLQKTLTKLGLDK